MSCTIENFYFKCECEKY